MGLVLLCGCEKMAEKEDDLMEVFSSTGRTLRDLVFDQEHAECVEQYLASLSSVSPTDTEFQMGQYTGRIVMAETENGTQPLYLIHTKDGWCIDCADSFALNQVPLREMETADDILEFRVTAVLTDYRPSRYKNFDDRMGVLLTDGYGNELKAMFPTSTQDGGDMYSLLSDGEPHRIRVILHRMDFGNSSIYRVMTYCGEEWLNPEDYLLKENKELLEALKANNPDEVKKYLNSGNISMVDGNGDGLLFLGLMTDNEEILSLLAENGVEEIENNKYHVDVGDMWKIERLNWEESLRSWEMERSLGCSENSVTEYLIKNSYWSLLDKALTYWEDLTYGSPDLETKIKDFYDTETEGSLNILDVAIYYNSPNAVRTCLEHGVDASSLLKEKLHNDPMGIESGIMEQLGKVGYFGELNDVLDDYKNFRFNYEMVAGEACQKFSELYEEYMEAAQDEYYYAAAAIMDNGLLEMIENQLAVIDSVPKPETEAIQSLWDMMWKYADTWDTAGYYFKRIARSTAQYKRRAARKYFELRLSQGAQYYDEFLNAMETYEEWLRNMENYQ